MPRFMLLITPCHERRRLMPVFATISHALMPRQQPPLHAVITPRLYEMPRSPPLRLLYRRHELRCRHAAAAPMPSSPAAPFERAACHAIVSAGR